jgi:hypothetical protein
MNPAVAQLIAEIAIYGIDLFISQMNQAHNAVDNFMSVIATGLYNATSALGNAIGSLGKSFVEFTSNAVQEATKVETMRITFEALTGSAEKAGYMMQQLRSYALKGVGEFDNLTQSAIRLYEAGLNPLRFIKMVDVMGKVVNPQNPAQGSFQISDAVARGVSGGNFGMALRVFRKVGIGINDMIAEGLNVSGGNHITEKFEGQFVLAIENIYRKKHLERLGTQLEGSMDVAFSNLRDSWNYLLSEFGAAWFPLIHKIVESVGSFLRFLSTSGEASKIGKGFADAFGSIFDKMGGANSIISFLSYLTATLEMLPSILKTVGKVVIDVSKALFTFVDTGVTKFVNNLINAFSEIMTFMKTITVGVLTLMHNLTSGLLAQTFGIKPIVSNDELAKIRAFDTSPKKFTGAGDMLGQAWNAATGAIGNKELSQFPNAIQQRHNQIMADYFADQKSPKGQFDDHSNDPLFNDLHTGANAQKQTAENTAKIAAHMDHFKRFALGGGDRGRVGVTVAEMYGSNGTLRVDMGRAANHFEKGTHEVAREMYSGMRRAGLGN